MADAILHRSLRAMNWSTMDEITRPGPHYKTESAFAAAVTDRLKAYCQTNNVFHQDARRLLLRETFYSRLFATAPDRWLLKGGSALAVRFERFRFTQDIDCAFAHKPGDGFHESAYVAITQACARTDLDPFTFKIEKTQPLRNVDAGISMRIAAVLNSKLFDRFKVDIVAPTPLCGPIVQTAPPRTIEVPDIPPCPHINLYPLEDHIADKVSGMYTKHGPRRIDSTRYRDLGDLDLILRQTRPDLHITEQALILRERWRPGSIPRRIQSPGASWRESFNEYALDTGLNVSYNEAIIRLAHHLNPVLQRVHSSPVLQRTIVQPLRRPDPGREM